MGLPRKLETLIGVAGLLVSSASSAAIYCCDDGGRRVCGDILPAACYGQSYREMGNDGSVRRQVSAPLTREEIARRKADEERRKVEEEARVKQERLDLALLGAYSSVEELDRRRDREIAELERSLDSAKERRTELHARRDRLQQDATAYKGKPLPRDIEVGIKSLDKELASYDSIITAKQSDIEAVRTRFASDRARYLELKAAPRSAR